jgi:predicted DNA-binding transcriptional regulator AlpA
MSDSIPTTDTAALFLRAPQAAARYGLSTRTWYRLVDAGRAPAPTRFGAAVRWSLAALEAWEAGGCQKVRHVPARAAGA